MAATSTSIEITPQPLLPADHSVAPKPSADVELPEEIVLSSGVPDELIKVKFSEFKGATDGPMSTPFIAIHRPYHNHELIQSRVAAELGVFCYACNFSLTTIGQRGLITRYSTCEGCKFNLCELCDHVPPAQRVFSTHPHALDYFLPVTRITDCGECKKPLPPSEGASWHCSVCKYDLCAACGDKLTAPPCAPVEFSEVSGRSVRVTLPTGDGVAWRLELKVRNCGTYTQILPAAVRSFKLSQLRPHTDYCIVIASILTNTRIESLLSPEAYVTTKRDVPSAPEAFAEVRQRKSATTLDVSWLPAIDDGGSMVSHYVVRCLPVKAGRIPPEVNVGNTLKCQIRELQPATQYSVAARACNAQGEGILTTPVLMGTLPGPVKDLKLKNLTQNQVELEWSDVSQGKGKSDEGAEPSLKDPAVISEYMVTVRAVVGDSAIERSANGTETAITIDGLIPGTRYLGRVAAVNCEGTGDSTEWLEFETPVGLTGSPEGLRMTHVTQTGAMLQWKAPEQTGGCAPTSYAVRWCELEMLDKAAPGPSVPALTTPSAVPTPLPPPATSSPGAPPPPPPLPPMPRPAAQRRRSLSPTNHAFVMEPRHWRGEPTGRVLPHGHGSVSSEESDETEESSSSVEQRDHRGHIIIRPQRERRPQRKPRAAAAVPRPPMGGRPLVMATTHRAEVNRHFDIANLGRPAGPQFERRDTIDRVHRHGIPQAQPIVLPPINTNAPPPPPPPPMVTTARGGLRIAARPVQNIIPMGLPFNPDDMPGGAQPKFSVKLCTYKETGATYRSQKWWECETCNFVGNYGVCESCKDVCHLGHVLKGPKESTFYCDCGSGMLCHAMDVDEARSHVIKYRTGGLAPKANGSALSRTWVPTVDQWKEKEWQEATCTASGPGPLITFPLRDLKPNSHYALEVYAVNAVGRSQSKAAIRAWTRAEPPANIATSNVTRSSVVVSCDRANSNWLVYSFVARSKDGKQTLCAEANGTPVTATITGLFSGTDYDIVACLQNANCRPDVVVESTPISVRTANSPPDPPSNVTAEQRTQTSFILKWTPPEKTGGDPIIGYKVTKRVAGGVFDAGVATGSKVAAAKLTNLSSGIKYYVRVMAVTASGESDGSVQIDVETMPGPPDPPTNVHCSGSTGDSMTITWTAPVNNGGSAITDYKVFRRKGDGDYDTTIVIPAPRTECKMFRLPVATKYYVKVRSRTAAGESADSQEAMASTFAEHNFVKKNLGSGITCMACDQPVTGLLKTGLECSGCQFVIHTGCRAQVTMGCTVK